jgi:transposase
MAALAVAGHLSAVELGRRYRAARDRVERGHLQAVWLLAQGRGRGEVARIMGWSGVWVAEVVRRYNEDGPERLGDRRRGNAGARPLLGAEDEAALRAALAAGPPADGGLWTGPKVAAWMGARLGRRVWPQRGWDYLRKLGYSPQVPRPRHAKAASPEEQTAYKKSSPRPWTSAARRGRSARSRCGRSTSTGSG